MQTKHLFVLTHISNKGELVPSNMYKPSNLFLLTVPRRCFFCYNLCFVSVMRSCLFLAALWSPAEKELTSWLSCMWCFFGVCLSLNHFVAWVRCGI